MRSGTAVQDFVIMMFLLGNDFLPHNEALETSADTIEALLNIYTQNNHHNFVTPQGAINLPNVLLYITQLAKQEPNLLYQLSQRADYVTTPLKLATQGRAFNVNTYRDAYYKKTLREPTDDKIKKLVKSYIKTMFWTYHYYTHGHNAVNQEWYYHDNYAPMLVDLAVFADGLTIHGYEAYKGMLTINPLHQLVSVLPKQSIDLIPPELRWLVTINSPLYDLFPTSFINDNEGKIHKKLVGRPTMDHGVALIPIPDRQRVIDVVSTIDMDDTPWDKQADLVSVVDRPKRQQMKPTYQPRQQYNQHNPSAGAKAPLFHQQQQNYNQPRQQYNQQQMNQQQNYNQQMRQPLQSRAPAFIPRQTFNVQAEEFVPQQRQSMRQPVHAQAKTLVTQQQNRIQQSPKPVYQPIVKANLPAMISMDVIKNYATTGALPKTAHQQLLEQSWG